MCYTIVTTGEFDKWLKKQDANIIGRVLSRLYRVENGNFGDTKKISENIYELRFFFGGGIRVYYSFVDSYTVIMLCGGNKSAQTRDIKNAVHILSKET